MIELVEDNVLSCNAQNGNSSNMVIEGENLDVMSLLLGGKYCYENKIDLMLWDPPYNTGRTDFIYNDRMKRAEWLSFMEVRLELAKKLLKESGNIAIHISYQQLFHLGLLMDGVFGENNRVGIINWECAYAPKNNNKGIPSTTDYVLIYAKNKNKMYMGLLPRTAKMDARYKNYDSDLNGEYVHGSLFEPKSGFMLGDLSSYSKDSGFVFDNLTGSIRNNSFGIENPITGKLYYPPSGRSWRYNKNRILEALAGWHVKYILNDTGDCVIQNGEDRNNAKIVQENGPLPRINFGILGNCGPRLKRYKSEIKNDGRITGTYWESEEINDYPCVINMRHEESGHNDGAKRLIKSILGDDCVFNTPKPLKLTERLTTMLCPTDGIVLDAFAGSATTAHAVLSLNNQYINRKFIMIEQGTFANIITAERIRRVINGKWAKHTKDTKPLGGSFVYLKSIPNSEIV